MKKIHFIGIGGIGVSALAAWYLANGWKVSGSDREASEITKTLAKKGAKIHIGAHRTSFLPKDASYVIHTAAIGLSNPERAAARHLGIAQLLYAEALGLLAKKYKVIAVAGAHGKSTTTAMVSLMLARAGFDPTVFIGTKVREFGMSNFRKGKSEWLVIEADEFNRSFLNYFPYAAIVTNIDREHLEYYKSFANIKRAFAKFISHVSAYAILNKENKYLNQIRFHSAAKTRWYGTNTARARELKKLLKVLGAHNLSNAMAADTLAASLGISKNIRNKSLLAFHGTWRRFEFRGIYKSARIYDDYGHHPTEIKATLGGAREAFPRSRIWCVFQPHHTERLARLFGEFTKAFDIADRITIVETYKVKGREHVRPRNDKNASRLGQILSKKRPTDYFKSQKETIARIRSGVMPGDVVIVMGAGDIWNITKTLLGR